MRCDRRRIGRPFAIRAHPCLPSLLCSCDACAMCPPPPGKQQCIRFVSQVRSFLLHRIALGYGPDGAPPSAPYGGEEDAVRLRDGMLKELARRKAAVAAVLQRCSRGTTEVQRSQPRASFRPCSKSVRAERGDCCTGGGVQLLRVRSHSRRQLKTTPLPRLRHSKGRPTKWGGHRKDQYDLGKGMTFADRKENVSRPFPQFRRFERLFVLLWRCGRAASAG